MGLRKTDFDLVDGLVRIERSIVLIGAEQVAKRQNRSRRPNRHLAGMVAAAYRGTLRDYPDLAPDGAVFVGPYRKKPARPNFSQIWRRSGLHFHDLRHTGNHLPRCLAPAPAS